MQKLILITSLMMLSAPAWSASKTCGLPKDTAALDDNAKTILSLDFRKKSKVQMTDTEEQMIVQSYPADGDAVSESEMLSGFADTDGGITYLSYNHQLYALVHCYPGDAEVGAIFKVDGVRKGNFELVANVGDGQISCN